MIDPNTNAVDYTRHGVRFIRLLEADPLDTSREIRLSDLILRARISPEAWGTAKAIYCLAGCGAWSEMSGATEKMLVYRLMDNRSLLVAVQPDVERFLAQRTDMSLRYAWDYVRSWLPGAEGLA
ncbi:hypothetical protein HYR69_06920 [Candidatus Sumerlaeota bacterium]|nr:hypothetical protein [Candidatus Sumerlaeota bacterium]